MSEPIEQVKTAFDSLLNNISKPRRRLMYQQIGRELARSQRRRIKAQQNPDGSAYEPRFMRLRLESEGVSLGYEGGDAVIARIHQQGLIGRVRKDWDLKVKYASRELLGFTDDDLQMIEDYMINILAGS
ncbi:phage virion morphogenesis protein [Mannheimia haemolytica]